MRMCFATKNDPYPTLESKLSFLVSDVQFLEKANITNLENRQPLMTLVKRDCPAGFLPDAPLSYNTGATGRRQKFTDLPLPLNDHGGKASTPHLPQVFVPVATGSYCDIITFTDAQFGEVAAQLYKKIEQNITRPLRSIPVRANKTNMHNLTTTQKTPQKKIAKDYQEQTIPSGSSMPWWSDILVLILGLVCVLIGAALLFSPKGYKRSSRREIDWVSDCSPSTSDFSPPA